jgi:hypothetical protein
MAYLRHMRVEQMARLLVSTDLSVAEAARSAGWRNQFHAIAARVAAAPLRSSRDNGQPGARSVRCGADVVGGVGALPVTQQHLLLMTDPQQADDQDGDQPGEPEGIPEPDDEEQVDPARSAIADDPA